MRSRRRTHVSVAKAFAPATVANVGVGFDILGFALSGLGEVATVIRDEDRRQVTLHPVRGFPQLPLDPSKNTATAGLVRLIHEKRLPHGFKVSLNKQIPIGSGLGGSSVSAVAAIVAANSLLKKKLTRKELLDYALTGEEVASRARHADNVAPCLEGGLVFTRGSRIVRIETPRNLRCVILLPRLSVNTKDARRILRPTIKLATVVEQTANLAGFLLGSMYGDFELIRESLRDVMIEPQRARLIRGFYDLQSVAMGSGALGCSLSGSGPAIFALAESPQKAEKIHRALLVRARNLHIPVVKSFVSPVASRGAHVVSDGFSDGGGIKIKGWSVKKQAKAP